MSRAFVKEETAEAIEELPDKPPAGEVELAVVAIRQGEE